MPTSFKGRNIRPYRLGVQLAVLLFLLSGLFGVNSFGSSPWLRRVFLPNAACRYIDSAPTYCFLYPLQDALTTGSDNFFIDALFILVIVLILVLLLGRLWCSWLCPFGLVQEGLIWLREKLGIPPLRLKWKNRMLLRQMKYAILFFTVLISVSIGIEALALTGQQSTLSTPFCKVCPAKGFFTLIQMAFGLLPADTALPLLAILMLIFFLISSFQVPMFWCRVCPMGALMALLSHHSFVWLKKDPDKCTKCRVCLRVCPLEHDRVYEEMKEKDVGGEDCTLCGKCVELCPEKDCLSLMAGTRTLVASARPKQQGKEEPGTNK